MKFPYTTRLNPSDKNSNNRIVVIGDSIAKVVVGEERFFVNFAAEELPFTNMIDHAWFDLSTGAEKTYYDIGTRPSFFNFAPSAAEYVHLNYMLLLLIMRRASARNLWFKTVPQYYASYIREEIINTHFAQRLKVEILRLLLSGVNPVKRMAQVEEFFLKKSFSRGTAKLFLWYWLSGEGEKSIKDLAKCNDKIILSFDALLEEANLITEESNLVSLASFSAGRKLRFISNSNRFDTKDLEQDLVYRARGVYLQCRPFLDKGHALNYARANISTYTLRIIQHFTRDSVARLVTDENGILTNRLVAIDDSISNGFSEDVMIEMLDEMRENGHFA